MQAIEQAATRDCIQKLCPNKINVCPDAFNLPFQLLRYDTIQNISKHSKSEKRFYLQSWLLQLTYVMQPRQGHFFQIFVCWLLK